MWSTVQQRTPPAGRVAVQDRPLSDVDRRVTPAEQVRRPCSALHGRVDANDREDAVMNEALKERQRIYVSHFEGRDNVVGPVVAEKSSSS